MEHPLQQRGCSEQIEMIGSLQTITELKPVGEKLILAVPVPVPIASKIGWRGGQAVGQSV
jgi:hypothetical protein